jgi:two-component system chemotaxis sensor kinase CheA
MPKDPYRFFRIELREILDSLNRGALEIEKGGRDPGAVAALLRGLHTLKGAARVVRLKPLAELAHAGESLLAPHRGDPSSLGTDAGARLRGLLGEMEKEARALPEPGGEASGSRPRETLRLETREVDSLLKGLAEASARAASLEESSRRVRGAAREAALLEERLARRPAGAKPLAGGSDLGSSLESLARGLEDGLAEVRRELSAAHERANRLRLIFAEALFAPLEAAAREAAGALGRRVRFEASGGGVRIDAFVLDSVREALLHVVRNSAAHGIEPEAERAALGKVPEGLIRIEVELQGSAALFSCIDDGRGIDAPAVARAALAAGLVSEAEAGALDEEAAGRLLLKGNLSTAASVSEISGRGLGMAVVREALERLRGEARLRSSKGAGLRVDLRVPAVMSSMPALLLEAAGSPVLIPVESVHRVLRLGPSDIARSPEGDSVCVDGHCVPFEPLSRALRIEPQPEPRKAWTAVVVRGPGGMAAVGVDRLLSTTEAVVEPLPALCAADAALAGASLDFEGNPRLVLDCGGLVSAVRSRPGRGALSREAERLPILVVDDSLTTRMLEQSILEGAGYAVELAASGEEALLKAGRRRYALFVVDVEMPGMSGFDFVSAVRASPDAALRATPAVIVTSRSSHEDRRRGEDAGAQAFICKGEFDQGFLLNTIRDLTR